ncbi:MAG TPA: divalent-cation tolerance protein CutA [Gemmatimonadales bacterium]|nr:divalent-cation tolerance protein CutA [Gemmatimonadales bacterium]
MTGFCQVITTWPDQESADAMAARAVRERLAACAQVSGPLASTYRWDDKIEQAKEWYCYLKTTLDRLPTLEARIRQVHPYDTPEIIAVPIMQGNPAYLDWIRDSVA